MALSKAQEENAKKNRAYWRKREEDALTKYKKSEAEYDKEIERIYADMLDRCNEQINAFYGKYASKEGISIAEAKKRVKQLDIKEYERKAAKYVRDAELDRKANGGKTNKKGYYFSPKAEEEMRLYNATMKINRLEMLKANIGLETIKGHDELDQFMGEILKGRTQEELERQAGILGKSVKNSAKYAHAIPNGSFHNASFSDRIWQYQNLMREDLSKILSRGLIQGKNPRAIAKDLKKYWYGNDPKTKGGAVYCMERLMRTEMARVQTEAQKQSFERNGIDQYTFIANRNCCDICKGLDGKHFYVEDMMPGENAAPLHPHCRCSVAAYVDRKELEAYFNYLDNGGTAEGWEQMKAGKKKVNNSFINKMVASGIMESRRFNTTDDPMREVTGPGLKSHPDEINEFLDEMIAEGVEIAYRDNAMAYQPSVVSGRPGKFIIDEEASYSAWKHEYTHFSDDKKDGYLGMRVFANLEKCIERETHAYDVEIEMAKELNRPDIVERLEKLKRKELKKYEPSTE